MQWLKDFLGSFFSLLWEIVGFCFDLLLDLILLFFFWFIDGLLTLVEVMVVSIDLSAIGLVYVAQWSHMPSQLIYLINILGIPQGLSIVAGAMFIRLLLNLVPAALTRV